LTIHCSICGKADHNKKDHQTYVDSQLEKMTMGIVGEDEKIDILEILEVLF
jgi:hypothetical protein